PRYHGARPWQRDPAHRRPAGAHRSSERPRCLRGRVQGRPLRHRRQARLPQGRRADRLRPRGPRRGSQGMAQGLRSHTRLTGTPGPTETEPESEGSRVWPVILTDRQSDIVLRPLRRRDEQQWREVRRFNRDWLRPWDATLPAPGQELPGFRSMVRMQDRQAKRSQSVPFAIEVGGDFRGQITVSGLSWGSILSGQIGYWIDSRVAGRGITPIAVAMAVDHCFFTLGLHRIEINIRPENTASLRVVDKLGLRDEGLRKGYMHIDGQWCDHRTFAVLAE